MLKLRLHTSNRLENLAEALAEEVRRPLRSPLEPETILVQSQGMARWLKLQLARHQGICSNFRFPFPRAFSYEAFKAVLGDLPAEEAYDPELLTWQVMKQIPALLGQPGFEALKNYLGTEHDNRKLYQLADRIAYVFDQYLVFRPDMVRQWEAGADQDWQAELWGGGSAPLRSESCINWQTASPTCSTNTWSFDPTWSGSGRQEPIRTGRRSCGARSAPRSASSIRPRCRRDSSSTWSRPPVRFRACPSGLPSLESRRCRLFTCGSSPRWPATRPEEHTSE